MSWASRFFPVWAASSPLASMSRARAEGASWDQSICASLQREKRNRSCEVRRPDPAAGLGVGGQFAGDVATASSGEVNAHFSQHIADPPEMPGCFQGW